MQIHTLELTKYKKNNVYVRLFGTTFEYIVVFNEQVYTAHVTIKPDVKNYMLYFLGRQKYPYSKDQIKKISEYLQQVAHATIDHLTSA